MSLRVCHQPAEWAEISRELARTSAVLTIGTFDGLHLGHQRILRRVVEVARQSALPSLAGAVTFDPHPSRVLRPEHAPPMIATLAQRLEGFQRQGLDAVLVLKFDAPLAQLPPEAFVNSILVEKLNASAVLVGENFRFGHRQGGDVAMLRELGQRFGFAVEVAPPVLLGGEIVSSTAIRRAVSAGDVKCAARLLGTPFALTGEVIRGSGQGHTHLVPTLNLAHEQELLPRYGVYVTEVELAGETFRAVTNVGVRPTLDGAKLAVESHLLDFDRERTAGRITVRFLARLREEKKFESLDALRQQIHRDIAAARDYFAASAAR